MQCRYGAYMGNFNSPSAPFFPTDDVHLYTRLFNRESFLHLLSIGTFVTLGIILSWVSLLEMTPPVGLDNQSFKKAAKE